MTKKIHLAASLLLVVLAVFLSGCEIGSGKGSSTEETVVERPGVTLKGKLVQAAGKYFLQANGKDTEIYSRKVDLMPKVGTEIEVFGEFSGTTLFVDEIK